MRRARQAYGALLPAARALPAAGALRRFQAALALRLAACHAPGLPRTWLASLSAESVRLCAQPLFGACLGTSLAELGQGGSEAAVSRARPVPARANATRPAVRPVQVASPPRAMSGAARADRAPVAARSRRQPELVTALPRRAAAALLAGSKVSERPEVAVGEAQLPRRGGVVPLLEDPRAVAQATPRPGAGSRLRLPSQRAWVAMRDRSAVPLPGRPSLPVASVFERAAVRDAARPDRRLGWPPPFRPWRALATADAAQGSAPAPWAIAVQGERASRALLQRLSAPAAPPSVASMGRDASAPANARRPASFEIEEGSTMPRSVAIPAPVQRVEATPAAPAPWIARPEVPAPAAPGPQPAARNDVHAWQAAPRAALLPLGAGHGDAAAAPEDLSALATKIKAILDEEARRHGIDV